MSYLHFLWCSSHLWFCRYRKGISDEHKCDPDLLKESKTLPPMLKGTSLQFLRASLPYRVHHEYVKWSGNSLLLYSSKIEGVVESLPKKTLSLRKGASESHWLSRAIRQQNTPTCANRVVTVFVPV